MLRYRKWVLTLGIMAVTPGITQAGPFQLFKKEPARKPAPSARKQESRTDNQKVAESIAGALRAERLTGFDIEIEFKNGVATLTGKIADLGQKTRATAAVAKLPGVDLVDNQLIVLENRSGQRAAQAPASAPAATNPAARTAAFEFPGKQAPSSVQQTAFNDPVPLPPGQPAAAQQSTAASNQQVAEQIAKELGRAKLRGYDIEIRFQNGTALLGGSVGSAEQKAAASQVVSQIPGVQYVDNQLTVGRRGAVQQGPPQSPIQPAAYAPQQPGQMAPNGAMMQQGPGMPPPPGYGHPGTGASNVVYNTPNLPGHAWPSYAAYPNYAQVTYPKEYSASAWPYIGPFYPYPQIPLGWRQAQLEWDDGSWNLNFKPRTDQWWWFLNPEKW